MPEEQKSFWSTIPGIITAFATSITAIGEFLVVLNQIGVFGTKTDPKPAEDKVATDAATPSEVENLSAGDMIAKQAALEAKLREMEQRMTEQRQAAQPPGETQPFQDIAQLHGTWYFDNGAFWNIQQSGVSIAVQEYSFLFGTQILTAGCQGMVVGQKAFVDFSTIGGGTGTAEMTLAAERTLTGSLKDGYGNTIMALHLTGSSEDE